MSRRRGLSHWLLLPLRGLAELFRIFVLVPYYESLQAMRAVGRSVTMGTGARSLTGIFVYYLLWLPRSLWHFCVVLTRSLFAAAGSWPRKMRLRDLATGLPALLVAMPVIYSLAMLHKDTAELRLMYQTGLSESVEEAAKIQDPVERKAATDRSLFFARSLVRLGPEEKPYRYNLAMLYFNVGDNDRALTMISDLAPRDTTGYGPAHLWRAKQILANPLNEETFRSAVAHLDRALASDDVEKNDVHRRLGELYWQTYLMLMRVGRNPLNLSSETLLKDAKQHLAAYDGKDPAVRLKLATVLATQGNFEQARLSMRNLIDSLDAKLKFNQDDVATRLELAQAYLIVKDFIPAADVLEKGRTSSPDPRLDWELSNVLFWQAMDTQQKMPTASALPYNELKKAFELNPGNGLVVARLLQGLLGTPAEQLIARQMFADLRGPAQRCGTAKFLLGFEAAQRGLPQIAEQSYREARASSDGDAPGVVAEVALAIMERKYPAISRQIGIEFFQKALLVWPSHPDLLVVRAYHELQTHQNANALSDLHKAVEGRQKDVTLKLRIASEARLYALLAQASAAVGQRIKAEEYQRLSQSAMAKQEPLK